MQREKWRGPWVICSCFRKQPAIQRNRSDNKAQSRARLTKRSPCTCPIPCFTCGEARTDGEQRMSCWIIMLNTTHVGPGSISSSRRGSCLHIIVPQSCTREGSIPSTRCRMWKVTLLTPTAFLNTASSGATVFQRQNIEGEEEIVNTAPPPSGPQVCFLHCCWDINSPLSPRPPFLPLHTMSIASLKVGP